MQRIKTGARTTGNDLCLKVNADKYTYHIILM